VKRNRWKCAHCRKVKRDIPSSGGFIFRSWTYERFADGKPKWNEEVRVCEECMDIEVVLDSMEW
jgi:hypothetical protein